LFSPVLSRKKGPPSKGRVGDEKGGVSPFLFFVRCKGGIRTAARGKGEVGGEFLFSKSRKEREGGSSPPTN